MGARYAVQLTFGNRLMERCATASRRRRRHGGSGGRRARPRQEGADGGRAARTRPAKLGGLLLYVLSPRTGDPGDKPLNGPAQLKLQVTLNDVLSEAGLIEVSHVTAGARRRRGRPRRAAARTSSSRRPSRSGGLSSPTSRSQKRPKAAPRRRRGGGGGRLAGVEGANRRAARVRPPPRLPALRSRLRVPQPHGNRAGRRLRPSKFGLLYQRVNVDNRSSQKDQPLSRRTTRRRSPASSSPVAATTATAAAPAAAALSRRERAAPRRRRRLPRGRDQLSAVPLHRLAAVARRGPVLRAAAVRLAQPARCAAHSRVDPQRARPRPPRRHHRRLPPPRRPRTHARVPREEPRQGTAARDRGRPAQPVGAREGAGCTWRPPSSSTSSRASSSSTR